MTAEKKTEVIARMEHAWTGNATVMMGLEDATAKSLTKMSANTARVTFSPIVPTL